MSKSKKIVKELKELKAGIPEMIPVRRCIRHFLNHPSVLYEAKSKPIGISSSMFRKAIKSFVKDSRIMEFPENLPQRIQAISKEHVFNLPIFKPVLTKYKNSVKSNTLPKNDPIIEFPEFYDVKDIFLEHCQMIKKQSQEPIVVRTTNTEYHVDSALHPRKEECSALAVGPSDFFEKLDEKERIKKGPQMAEEDRPANWGQVEVVSLLNPHLNDIDENGKGFLNFHSDLQQDMKMASLFTKYYGKSGENTEMDMYAVATKIMKTPKAALMRRRRQRKSKYPAENLGLLGREGSDLIRK